MKNIIQEVKDEFEDINDLSSMLNSDYSFDPPASSEEISNWEKENNIKNIIKSKGFKISDVQARCGFNTPQAIFKWMRGDAVPTIDNLIILADMFDVPIDKIIIVTRI